MTVSSRLHARAVANKMASRLIWDNKQEMDLLKLYFSEKILWDTNHPCYKDKSLNYEAWKRISDAMEIEIDDIKKKKESLMSSYRLYRNKIKRSILSGSDKVYKPIWFAYSFMDSHLSKRGKVNNTIVDTTMTDNEDDTYDDPLCQEDDKGAVYLIPMANERSSRDRPLKRPRRRSTPEPQEASSLFEDGLAGISKALSSRIYTQEREDDCDRYGKMLANKLRKLPEDERLIFMHEIDGLFLQRIQNYSP